ncbi:MAG: hypothetical protein RMJ56_10510 [Gemmataceae bacterium]|nr:hypothetical protein [Gemmata sp.]MDW8198021.1 hypothetical protein [Gemmataceae bacterium]
MMFTVLTVAVFVGALLAVYVHSTKHYAVEALTGETTLANSLPEAETLRIVRQESPPPSPEWRMTTVNALHDAEELLDLLEYQGFTEREILVLGHSQFAVRWK